MRSTRHLLHRSLVGLAMIFSASAGAAGLSCTASGDGFRCEAWPQGTSYRYEWHVAGKSERTSAISRNLAVHTIGCQDKRASAIAVSVIAPAGYIETATQLLPACGHTELDSDIGATALARSQ
ncbi:hypothetical protein DFR29_106270 [Tahibacter aquaticus]|uniref:Ig-like domain-containing protein n=1 Tax=Tahibacter aquaticus TaxID=520092 RepID=A0A4R6YYR2_9GAMM|nr:hypothetical protein [Tahibacter aquaticus]TDR44122.1 hypothetical protein DFR29_106270 [Tahibacter aquaticus]